MIKFESSLDEGYTKIKENIDEMIKSATEGELSGRSNVLRL